MNSISQVCRRHRRLLLAAGYLLVLAFAVIYLRVTISVPPEGDDKLTLNAWMYDFQRMPFWQYLLQDLRQRLGYFLLEEVRFFPFHYPSAISLLFFGSLTSYRLYIIGVTAAAAFLTGRVIARLSASEGLALGGFTLALALAPIFNEGMYSYYAVPQKALFWAMAAWLCLLHLQDTGRRSWGVGAAVLAFISCGTYEIGYMYTVIVAGVFLVLSRSVKKSLAALCSGPWRHRCGTGVSPCILPRLRFHRQRTGCESAGNCPGHGTANDCFHSLFQSHDAG